MSTTETLTSVTTAFMVEKETKGTFKFAEVPAKGDAVAIGALYVKKHVIEQMGNPELLKVVISTD